MSARIGEAVNHRFHIFDHGIKEGVATPKTDEFIVLDVHPRYKDNISRYMRVVRALADQRIDRRTVRAAAIARAAIAPIR